MKSTLINRTKQMDYNEHEYESRMCPVCEVDNCIKLFNQSFATLDFLKGYNVVICKNCGMAYANNIPTQKEFDHYYAEMSKYENYCTGGYASQQDAERFVDIAKMVRKNFSDQKIFIVEVGCSTGGLLHCLKDEGFYNLLGIDPSSKCSELANNVYKIPVMVGSFSNVRLDKKADLLIVIAVLEHIVDMKDIFCHISQMVNDNGYLLIEVPDAEKFSQYPDAPFQQFSTEHVNYFSHNSLLQLLQMNNFECIELYRCTRLQSEIQTMPSVVGLFKKQSKMICSKVSYDNTTMVALQEYISVSHEVLEKVVPVFEQLAKSKEQIYVWGVGTHTLRLIASGGFTHVNVIGFFDSNPKYWEKKLEGMTVYGPEKLKEIKQRILISSRVHQEEIKWLIEEKFQFKHGTITLY